MAEFVCPFRFPAFGFRLAPNSELRGGILSASKKSSFNKSYKNPKLPDFTYDMIGIHINSQIDQKIQDVNEYYEQPQCNAEELRRLKMLTFFLLGVCLLLGFGGIMVFFVMQRNVKQLLSMHDLNQSGSKNSKNIAIKEISSSSQSS